MAIRPIDLTSPNFPLPEDYQDLTAEGQRQARVNGCRQWLVPRDDLAEAGSVYVSCIRFFDLFYLHPDIAADVDSLFYDMAPLPTPAGHFDIYRQWATNRLSIGIAPRGFAKSTVVKISCAMELVSSTRHSIIYATSSGDNTKNVGQSLKDQFVHNNRLRDDWGPECPEGRLVPKRGEAPFGATHMQLMNGSWIRCISAESKQRGMRPRLYVLDDPEYDPKAATSMQIIRDYMDVLLFKMVLPMVMRAGCGCRWLATFVSRRHYAWHAMDVDGRGMAKDPRFNNWDRIIIRSEFTNSEGEACSCWPEMWPPTKAKREEWAETDKHYEKVMSLEEIKETIGIANYLSEYMAKPGEGDEIFFPALDEEKHGYWFEKVDMYLETDPTISESLICYWSADKEGHRKLVRQPICTWMREVRLFTTVDTSYSAGPDSDSKVSMVMAITHANELFVLDLWSRQCHQPELVDNVFLQADVWKVPTIHIEAIKEGLGVYQDCEAIVYQRASELVDVEHLPGIRKINPGVTSKQAKIAALLRRFNFGKVKLPMRRRQEKGGWKHLFNQIEEFNPDAPDGGLQHDDEIDCLAMHQFVVKGRVQKFVDGGRKERTPLECIAAGEYIDPISGIPHAHKLDLQNIDVEAVMAIVDSHTSSKHTDGRTRV